MSIIDANVCGVVWCVMCVYGGLCVIGIATMLKYILLGSIVIKANHIVKYFWCLNFETYMRTC